MHPDDRQRLESLGFSAEIVAKAEEVLRVWGVDRLFASCSVCGKPCYNPDLPHKKHLRKKLPAELFFSELRGYRNREGDVLCEPCDDFQFERGW